MGDMDSENSGSIQSSSTGGADDHEYDSHGGGAASGSLLFNPMSCFNINTMPMAACSSTPLQLYSFNNGSSSSSSFSPHHQIGTISNFFDHPPPTLPLTSFHNNNNNNNNNNNDNNNNQVDIGWPEKFGSIRQSISTDDTNCTEAPLGYSITNNNQQLQQNPNPNPSPSSLLPVPGQGQAQGPTVSLGSPRSSSALGSGRNPKKRSRASRRAPTTVLTTDTTNFRQMVQEFTGIPSPPFTAFSPRTRYDLFTGLTHSNSSTTTMAAPSYLLRPFAQKISPLQQSLQFSTHNSNPLSDVLGLGTVTAATPSASHTAAPAPSTNFELCDAQNYLTTNPQLSFQSLLQPSSSHPTAQNSSSVNPTAGNYLAITSIPDSVAANGVSDNINGGSTKGEGMVDSWICASD